MARLRWELPDARFFDPDPVQRLIGKELYESIAGLPLLCPHGHVDPALLAGDDASFGSPADLFIIPDHYVFRMLYSQGVPLEALGIPRADGGPVETDHRRIWQLFADHFYLFRGTPTGLWLTLELRDVFGIPQRLGPDTAQPVYDQIEQKLARPEFRPRALFERFHVELLSTTDAATDPLSHHQAMRASGWKGDVRPTFRPDGVVKLLAPAWRGQIDALSQQSGITVDSYARYIMALENRRAFFKSMGAFATDHDVASAYTCELSDAEADAILQRALCGQATLDDDRRFSAHMWMQFARMSIDDGLVMQMHVGSVRNHNLPLYARFGPDRGSDTPQQGEFTNNLRPLLNKYGADGRLRLILFALDESAFVRELAPLAGHYPALRLGGPWWFQDSLNGMRRYFDTILDVAGLYNTAGFAEDTRAFPSIPVRHDLWRRASANWLAGLVIRGVIDQEEAVEMAYEVAYGLAKRAYRLG